MHVIKRPSGENKQINNKQKLQEFGAEITETAVFTSDLSRL